MAQRRIDVVLDSVRRLIRLGATANLVNLLHKQHPADLAQVFSDLGEKDRAFGAVQPAVGRLVLFPSYMWHGTIPFQSEASRLPFRTGWPP